MKAYEKVSEGVYRIKGKRSNIYLVADQQLCLIDTGMPGDEQLILDTVQDIGHAPDELKYIFITHAHLDHVGALAAVKAATGARVVASRAETDHIEGRRMLCSMNREGLGGAVFRVILFLLEKFLVGYAPAGVDIAWQDNAAEAAVAGLQIVAAPGHSPGSLCFLHVEKKILFTGDALSNAPHLRLPPRAGCSDYGQALCSAQRLAELDFQVCLFGHGEPVASTARAQVRDLLANPR